MIAESPETLSVIAIGHTTPVSLDGAKFHAAKFSAGLDIGIDHIKAPGEAMG